MEHSSDLDQGAILCDGRVVRDLDGLLLERVDVGDAVDEGDEPVDPGVERLEILAAALNHEGLLLRHDAHAQVYRGRQRADRRGGSPVPAAAGP